MFTDHHQPANTMTAVTAQAAGKKRRWGERIGCRAHWCGSPGFPRLRSWPGCTRSAPARLVTGFWQFFAWSFVFRLWSFILYIHLGKSWWSNENEMQHLQIWKDKESGSRSEVTLVECVLWPTGRNNAQWQWRKIKEAAKRTTSCFTSLAKSSSSTSPSDTHLVILSLKTTIDHHWESETSQAPNKLMPYILCQIKPHYLTLDFLFKLTLNYFCHKRPSTTIGIGIKKHVTYFMTRSCFFIFKQIVSKVATASYFPVLCQWVPFHLQQGHFHHWGSDPKKSLSVN